MAIPADHSYLVAIGVALAVGALVYLHAAHTAAPTFVAKTAAPPSPEGFVDFYGKNIRGYLFSGFLTLGAFMLSLKTFIVVKMKEGLFDQKDYRKRHTESVKAGGDRDMYKPLIALRAFLLWSIIASLTTAAIQMTIGLVSAPWAVAVAIGCVFFTLVLLFRCLGAINASLSMLFRYAQEAREAELAELVPVDK